MTNDNGSHKFQRSALGQALFDFGLETARMQNLARLVSEVKMQHVEISERRRRIAALYGVSAAEEATNEK